MYFFLIDFYALLPTIKALLLRYFDPNYGIFIPYSQKLVMNWIAPTYRKILNITVHFGKKKASNW